MVIKEYAISIDRTMDFVILTHAIDERGARIVAQYPSEVSHDALYTWRTRRRYLAESGHVLADEYHIQEQWLPLPGVLPDPRTCSSPVSDVGGLTSYRIYIIGNERKEVKYPASS